MNYLNIPVFIISRDRLKPLLLLIKWLEKAKQKNIFIVDNASTYPPLVRYLSQTPHTVLKLNENMGPKSPWISGIVKKHANENFYIVTDPDVIPTNECPLDAINYFYKLANKYPQYNSVGFGLKIDDIPVHYKFHEEVKIWERQYYSSEVEHLVYEAKIDTTFALYRPNSKHSVKLPAIRTGGAYTAQHLPWYSDSLNLTDEEMYYKNNSIASVTTWGKENLPDAFKQETERMKEESNKESLSSYYSNANQSLYENLPSNLGRVLEFGCSGGALGAQYKENNKDVVWHGIDIHKQSITEAKKKIDGAWVMDANKFKPNRTQKQKPYDALVYGDVIEHLIDPKTSLTSHLDLLSDKGSIIACIPNIQHWTIMRHILSGDWDYRDSGILDNTHLRFFTRKSIIKLFTSLGYNITNIVRYSYENKGGFTKPASIKSRKDFLSAAKELNHKCGLEYNEYDFRTFQYVIQAQPNETVK